MTVVVLGIDALDPDLVDPTEHPNLTLDSFRAIETIDSSAGEPSTHELWPTIITGLRPSEHGLVLDDGVAWDNRVLRYGSTLADFVLPDTLQTRLGAWMLTNTSADAFRTPALYYEENGLGTVFDDREAKPIGIPNYVIDPNTEDREHALRRNMGSLFQRDPEARGGHRSADPYEFYERCMEMAMVRIALARRALRGGRYEFVFAYTSALDLIGHVTHGLPSLQQKAYQELDEFVGELRDDLHGDDTLLLVSDHGLQDGIHTHEAMIAGTTPDLVASVESVLDVRSAIDSEFDRHEHAAERPHHDSSMTSDRVKRQLEDLGYM